VDLTNEDVADILALLDSLPYDELELQTSRFRLILRRTPGGWTQSTEILPAKASPATGTMDHRGRHGDSDGPSSPSARRPAEDGGIAGDGGTAEDSGTAKHNEQSGAAHLVPVRAPLPGTFYRAPRPGAAPFVEVGSRVSTDSVVGIVETMKLMNSVHAGVAGTVAEICLGNAEFAAHGATLVRIEVDG
jgi:acetyl-CoA carboxylase biotin carboxyl carrier protein